ncbi:hypothetical protein BD626DRAFT_612165 [Schizophyllum amplum]|uniref:Uncharacterized protein n=1 Tax=Schizophyllum amplum TaxID=97359 RepID=A0A550BZZ4_9AGAR|nr:hypothetical protein BD626DRAFT_612165 [Auriculariopsis ampla]
MNNFGNGFYNNGFAGYAGNNNGANMNANNAFGNYAANNHNGGFGGHGPAGGFAQNDPRLPFGPIDPPAPHPLRAEDTFAPQAGPTPHAQMLIYALRNADHPTDFLGDALQHILRGDTSPDAPRKLLEGLEGCGALLTRARQAAADAKARHCKRCHREYRELDNHPGACALAHDAPIRLSNDDWMRLCCDKMVSAGAPCPPPMVARHTTQDMVMDMRRPVMVEGINVWSGHFCTCEQNQCQFAGMQL